MKRHAVKILAVVVFTAFLASTTSAFLVSQSTRQSSKAGSIALPSTAITPEYGVLNGDPTLARMDYGAGIRLAMVPLNWSLWQPSAGTFSATYEAQELGVVNQFIQQGFTVGINMALNNAPSWALSTPNNQLVDQFGTQSGTLNFEFSSAVQSLTGAYVSSVVATFGSRISYYTLGASLTTEAIYPTTSTNQWWAFDAYAQNQQSGLPAGVGPNPLPGWIPGASTYNGTTLTNAQVLGWYNWYIGALANFIGWEKALIDGAGYTGYYQLNWPGTGANPWVYNYRLTTDLAATSHDTFGDLNDGAVYSVLLNDLPDLTGVVVDVTSVGDGSGTPANNACQSGDANVNYQTDSSVDSWSSTRVLAYLAGQHNLPIIGESTGQNSTAQMATDFTVTEACGLIGLQWAFDIQLYNGSYATLTDYSNQINDTPPTNGSPTVTAIDTIVGPAAAGTTINLYGANFNTATAVKFGSTPAKSFNIKNASDIAVVAPTIGAGAANVTVTNPSGTSAVTAADVFTGYLVPSIQRGEPFGGSAHRRHHRHRHGRQLRSDQPGDVRHDGGAELHRQQLHPDHRSVAGRVQLPQHQRHKPGRDQPGGLRRSVHLVRRRRDHRHQPIGRPPGGGNHRHHLRQRVYRHRPPSTSGPPRRRTSPSTVTETSPQSPPPGPGITT